MQRKVVNVLTITTAAAQAIQAITSQPGVPEGAGLKISGQPTPEGMAIELNVSEAPEASDQVVETPDANVFVAEPLGPMLDDKILDAGVQDDKIAFQLLEQPPTQGT